jgi:hypothetical protein
MEERDAMTWAAIAFFTVFALVPVLVLFLIATVLQSPDRSNARGRTTGFGHLTVDQLKATLMMLFPQEAYVLVRGQIARIQAAPPVRLPIAMCLRVAHRIEVSFLLRDVLIRASSDGRDSGRRRFPRPGSTPRQGRAVSQVQAIMSS